jgi:hypothetical protein
MGHSAPIVDAVALHHKPAWLNDSGFSPITAVHAANILANEQHPIELGFQHSDFNLEYLDAGGLTIPVDGWRNSCVSHE